MRKPPRPEQKLDSSISFQKPQILPVLILMDLSNMSYWQGLMGFGNSTALFSFREKEKEKKRERKEEEEVQP